MKPILKKIFLYLLLINSTYCLAQNEGTWKTDTIKVTISPSSNDSILKRADIIQTSKYNKWSIYGYGGLTQLYGDVVPHYSYSPIFKRGNDISLNGFVGVSRQLTRLFSIDGRFEVANLVSERPYSDIYCKADMFYYSVGTTFSFSNWFWPNVKNRKWNSYMILSTGFTHYRSASFDTQTDDIIDYYGYKKVNNTLEKVKREVVPSAAIGIGVKYRLLKCLDIGFEIIETSVYNDRLDAYVRVLSEKDKFGHTSIGLIYRFENHKKSLVWDFADEPIFVDFIVKSQLCDCPIISQTVSTLDSLTQTVINNTNRTDSIYHFLDKERGADFDNDKIPDYRDEELNTLPGAIVDSRGVTLKNIQNIPFANNNNISDSTTTPNLPQMAELQNYYNQLTIKVDSFFKFIESERGPDNDNDGIPDYRDDELNSAKGVIVNHQGITIIIPSAIPKFPIDTNTKLSNSEIFALQSYYDSKILKIDSFFKLMDKERGLDIDFDGVPDYRDDELNTKKGNIVDSRGLTIRIPDKTPHNATTNNQNIVLPDDKNNNLSANIDSLYFIVKNIHKAIDTLKSKQVALNNNIGNLNNDVNPNSNLSQQNTNNYTIPSKEMVTYKGVVKDEYNNPIKASVFVLDKATNELVGSFETNSITGKYLISLPLGEYSLLVSADGYNFYSENLSLKDSTGNLEKGISLGRLDIGKKFVLRNIFFDFDKSTLRPQSNIELNNLYNIMVTNPKLRIEISGHTDIIGSAEYNKSLSMRRAMAVVDYLISRGISKNRMTYAGYGFDEPMAPNDTDEGRQLNRRTEFKIIGN